MIVSSHWAPRCLALALVTELASQSAEITTSNPRYFATEPLGAVTFFVADTKDHGSELWYMVDGPPRRVTDIGPGPVGCNPRHLTTLGDGFVVFSAETVVGSELDVELWASDARSTGAVRLGDIYEGGVGSHPGQLTRVGSTIFFVAEQSTVSNGRIGRELWRTDGTPVGTVLVKDINTQPNIGSDPDHLTNLGGVLYFTADDGASGRELWKSDGTANGTVRVRDIRAGLGSSAPSNLLAYGPRLLFAADDGVSGRELWVSDGSQAGTTLVRDIRTGSLGSAPLDLTMGLQAMFTADDGVSGRELWKTDGTQGGTVLVKDIVPGSGSSRITHLTWCLLRHFFAADDGVNGNELWVTNGDAAGTMLVADICPNVAGCFPDALLADGLNVLFTADNGTQGRELWRSDGTVAGTSMTPAGGIRPGLASSDPAYLHRRSTPGQNHPILFTAENASSGRELWVIPSGGTPVLWEDINIVIPCVGCPPLQSQPGFEYLGSTEIGGNVHSRFRVFSPPGVGGGLGSLIFATDGSPEIALAGFRGSLRVSFGTGTHVMVPFALDASGNFVGGFSHPPVGPLTIQGAVLENRAVTPEASFTTNGVTSSGRDDGVGYSISVQNGHFSDRTFHYRLPILGNNVSGPATLTLGLVYRRFLRVQGGTEEFEDSFVRIVPFQSATASNPWILEGNVELLPLTFTRKSDKLELRTYTSWPSKPSDPHTLVWMSNC